MCVFTIKKQHFLLGNARNSHFICCCFHTQWRENSETVAATFTININTRRVINYTHGSDMRLFETKDGCCTVFYICCLWWFWWWWCCQSLYTCFVLTSYRSYKRNSKKKNVYIYTFKSSWKAAEDAYAYFCFVYAEFCWRV